MLKVTKNQGINLSLENTFQKTRAAGGQFDYFVYFYVYFVDFKMKPLRINT